MGARVRRGGWGRGGVRLGEVWGGGLVLPAPGSVDLPAPAPTAVSALLAAVHAGDDERVSLLLRSHAAEQPDTRVVQLRLVMGEPPPRPRPSPLLAWRDRHGRTPLHRAVRALQYGAAQLILEAGADVNAVDNEGRRPVHDAPSGSALQNLLVYYVRALAPAPPPPSPHRPTPPPPGSGPSGARQVGQNAGVERSPSAAATTAASSSSSSSSHSGRGTRDAP